jgi:hypothetical protein
MIGSRLTLHIETQPDGHGIAGQLRDPRGAEHQFTGWLGLLTLLEEARLAVAADRAGGPDNHERGRREHETDR